MGSVDIFDAWPEPLEEEHDLRSFMGMEGVIVVGVVGDAELEDGADYAKCFRC